MSQVLLLYESFSDESADEYKYVKPYAKCHPPEVSAFLKHLPLLYFYLAGEYSIDHSSFPKHQNNRLHYCLERQGKQTAVPAFDR